MGKSKKKQANRKVIVFGTLVGVLTLTSALLLAIAPAPLRPEASNTLFAVDAPESMASVFQTQIEAKPGRWKYIYIHHSRTPSGSALAGEQQAIGMGDHFVIGNGDGAADGQVQICPRWDRQLSAAPPVGAGDIDAACISICLVGDFDHSMPTPMQLRRIQSLVSALQGRLGIRSQDVVLLADANSAAGTGRYFPMTAFKEQLLP
ncbi:MAG TPA: peptidoglycan recognition family protein [Tepidisphaeraceae bacterium]|nr:peptidoglycan recognition family protein [Tepidisphaeraceae bacterium]